MGTLGFLSLLLSMFWPARLDSSQHWNAWNYILACPYQDLKKFYWIYFIQIIIFTSKAVGLLFWNKSSLYMALYCTLLSFLAYLAEMTYFMANITSLIFSPTCILFVEVPQFWHFDLLLLLLFLPWPLFIWLMLVITKCILTLDWNISWY